MNFLVEAVHKKTFVPVIIMVGVKETNRKGKPMATSNVYGIVESLGRSAFRHDGEGLTDGQLLGRFVELDDEASLSASVELSGASTGAINVKTSLDYSLSGASTLRYQGNPKIGSARSSGASSLRHERNR
jgi:hypothetical protein